MIFLNRNLYSIGHRSDKLGISQRWPRIGFTKIVDLMTPGELFIVLGHGHVSHIEKIHYLLTIFVSSSGHGSGKLRIKYLLSRKG